MPKEKITFKVIGVHCAACALPLERVLNRIESVKANVNFVLEKVFIEYDPERVDIPKIRKIIKDFGYEILGDM